MPKVDSLGITSLGEEQVWWTRTIRIIIGAASIVIALVWVSNKVAQVILWVLGGGVLPARMRHCSKSVQGLSLLGLGIPGFAGSRCQREIGGIESITLENEGWERDTSVTEPMET